jgi:uncharacterized membrane protein
VDLEINAISEREITKLMELVADIHAHITGEDTLDPEAEDMGKRTRISEVSDAVDSVEASQNGKGPTSAADKDS